MAWDKTNKAPAAAPSTEMSGRLVWEKEKVTEDELSTLWRNVAKITTAEHAEQAALETHRDTFWPQIEALANRCDEILTEHGFPHAAELVRHDGAGKWWRHPPDTPKRPPTGETWKFTRSEALAQEYSPGFSDPWYAARIGFQCRLVLEHFRKGDAGAPFLLSMIFEIATLKKDWQWRRGQKPSILTGRKQRGHLTDLRDTQNRSTKALVATRREAIAEMINETSLTGGALTAWLEKMLFDRHGIKASPRTIRGDRKALRE